MSFVQPASPPARQPASPPARQPASPPARQPASPPARQPASPTGEEEGILTSPVSSPDGLIDVLHAEDDPLSRHAVKRLLHGRARLLEPVCSVGALEERLRGGRNFHILLLDLVLGHQSALPHLRRYIRVYPGLKVLVLTGLDGLPVVQQCLAAGAMGVVSKLYAPDHLVHAIAEVHAGRQFVSPECDVPPGVSAEALAGLGLRSLRILCLLRKGLTYLEIADLEYVEVTTVEYHATKLRKVLGMGPGRGGWELL